MLTVTCMTLTTYVPSTFFVCTALLMSNLIERFMQRVLVLMP